MREHLIRSLSDADEDEVRAKNLPTMSNQERKYTPN